MKHKNVKSILESICTDVWTERSLDKAKKIVIDKITNSNINADSKLDIISTVTSIHTKPKLDSYIANSMLKFEGLGTKAW